MIGEKELIEKKYSLRYSIGLEFFLDGDKVIFWDGVYFWCYDFKKVLKCNILVGLEVFFVDKEYDMYGYILSYGFVGWVKDWNVILVNYKFDLWIFLLDGKGIVENLIVLVIVKDVICFCFEDYSFIREFEIEDCYIDFFVFNFLYVFYIKSKYVGYY